jgi:hypothetical protein
VIQVRVGQSDCLQVEAAAFESFDDAFSLVARIDADRLPGRFAANDARVLLKGCDG